jgi:hypothetical protein
VLPTALIAEQTTVECPRLPSTRVRTLAEVLSVDGPAPVLIGIDLLSQVAARLEQLHSQGRVHGEVVAENVLIAVERGRLVATLAPGVRSGWSTACEVWPLAEPSVARDLQALDELVRATLGGESADLPRGQIASTSALQPQVRITMWLVSGLLAVAFVLGAALFGGSF